MQQLVRRHDASGHVVIMDMIAAHQKQISRWQHRQRHPRIRQPLGRCFEGRHRKAGRRPGYVADRDTTAIFVLVGTTADMFKVHIVSGRTEIQMHVDVDVELAGHLEDAINLPRRITIGVRRAAYHAAAAFERLHHQLVRARIVEQALLREDADIKVDRPGIFLDQWHHTFEAAQPDAGIHFQVRAHMRRALKDRLFQRALRARIYIFRRERQLGLGSLRDRLLEVAQVRTRWGRSLNPLSSMKTMVRRSQRAFF